MNGIFSRSVPGVDSALTFLNELEQIITPIISCFKTEVYEPYRSNIQNQQVFRAVKHYEPSMCKVRLETKLGDYCKLEFKNGALELDRLNLIPTVPLYGELVTTALEEDGDHLDFQIFTPRPFSNVITPATEVIKVYPLLAIEVEDDDCRDIKIVAIPADLLLHYDMSIRFTLGLVDYVATLVLKNILFKGFPQQNALSKVKRIWAYEETVNYVHSRII